MRALALPIRHLLSAVTLSGLSLVASSTAAAFPRFGVELAAGQNLGVTSYVDNIVVLQGDLPLLADELIGSGAGFHLAFIFSKWSVGAEVRLFDRDTIRLHHRGTEAIPSGRIRPDGSVDDSGTDYVPFGPVRSPSPRTQPGDLLLIDIGASHRFYLLDGPFSLWFPVGASIIATRVMETSQPTVLGLGANVGVGAGYAIAPPITVIVTGKMHGILTPAYRPLADAARGSYTVGETTEEAVFSSMAYGSAMVGLQFTIR